MLPVFLKLAIKLRNELPCQGGVLLGRLGGVFFGELPGPETTYSALETQAVAWCVCSLVGLMALDHRGQLQTSHGH